MKDYPGGLIVHRGSRTERLADELARHLEAQRPANPLAAQTVVVAHPGLQRWLAGHLARRPGPDGRPGIAANYRMILPWEWFEQTAKRVLGEDNLVGGSWRTEVLRWRLLALLPTLDAPQIRAYLGGDDAPRRVFQLAEYLAGIYTQYLIYRPDWILDWERHPERHADDWQAVLWQQLQAGIARPHRARRGEDLLAALHDGSDSAREPLHVFGVSHLPPDVLAALQATSRHVPVHLYFPDPCREYWSDLRSRRFQLMQAGDPEALYYEIGHPLLVALGRIAQDFCVTLDESDAIEERDALDEAEPLPDANTLLARLQSSIRCLQPELVGAGRDETADPRDDASLRVHVCHTRLRELEVLKDQLLRRLADDPSLQHRDIVVMAPDISAYAPYLAAVFGEPAQYRDDPQHLPWHLADVGLSRVHPLMSAFGQLLQLAESRFTVSEVLDFLDVPAVARRFAIDADGREALERWLRRARVAWGLDARMKAETGAAANDANSWQFGFDRLYAGLIVGQNGTSGGHDGQPELLDGILPLEGVHGSAVEALGQFDCLLDRLRRARDEFARPRPLAAWSEWLLGLLDELFLPELRDDAGNHALDTLRRLVAGLRGQAHDTELQQELPWSVVREALQAALEAVPERQAFLLGGITFCGLVPQRSIPFRVVGLLGMNEGDFPRPRHDAGLNRIPQQPRRGDRDTRSEDRYLFLEALMSARDALHISYVGEGVRDGKARNPAAPLAELLQFLDQQYGLTEDDPRPWLLRHPLQPFDARYYERADDGSPRHDPRLFSYNRAYLANSGSGEPPRFVQDWSATPPAAESHAELSLATLRRYWRDPASDELLRGQGISLQALDSASWPDREPLEARIDRIERVDRRLLFEALASGHDELPAEPPAWLARSGMLAGGAIGATAYAELRESLHELLVGARPLFGGAARPQPQAVDLDLRNGLRLTGEVDRVFTSPEGLLLFDAQPARSAGLKDLLGFYIDWAVLRLELGDTLQGEYLEPATNGKPRRSGLLEPILAQSPTQLREGLRRLAAVCLSTDRPPLLFFPHTAQAWASAKPEQRADRAAAAWEGDGHHPGERDYAPGYAALLSRGLDLFDPASPAHQAFVAATELVCGVIDPNRSLLLKETGDER